MDLICAECGKDLPDDHPSDFCSRRCEKSFDEMLVQLDMEEDDQRPYRVQSTHSYDAVWSAAREIDGKKP